MTVPVCDLIACVNASINAVSTCDLTLLQLSSVAQDFDRGFVQSVQDVTSLPDATQNKGRMIYVQAVCGYRISDGVTWSNDFSSVIENSQIYSWGSNITGALGDNTTTNRSSPVSLVGGFSDWCTVSAGYDHGLATRTGGTAWAWGQNADGRLGTNTTTNSSSPVSVVGGFTNWCAVSTSFTGSAALNTTGGLWVWGRNVEGQLGDNTTTNRSSPVSLVGGFSDWCLVDSGSSHTLAIRTDSSLWAWGQNSFGRLGDNTTTDRSSPVSVVGGFTNWCSASGGEFHTSAVRTNGTTWSWGLGTSGQLGNLTVNSISSPVSVVGGFMDWCNTTSGARHTLAIRSNGTAWSWGRNFCGELGDGSTTDRSSPVSVLGGFTNWCQIKSGRYHAIALTYSSQAWTWGSNDTGQLGINLTTNRSSPVSVVGGLNDWYQVTACKSTMALSASRGSL